MRSAYARNPPSVAAPAPATSAAASGEPVSVRVHALTARTRRSGNILADTALVVLGNERLLVFVAAVQERQLEGEADVVKQRRVLGPGHHRARRHDGGQIPVRKPAA